MLIKVPKKHQDELGLEADYSVVKRHDSYWARCVVRDTEKVEKGSFLAICLFGDDFPEDETIEELSSTDFTHLLKASKRKSDFMSISGRKRIEAEPDEVTDVEDKDVKPAPVPKDATPPEEDPPTEEELDQALEEYGEETEKGVVVIDLVGDDDVDPHDDTTEPAPEVPPEPADVSPQLQEYDWDYVPAVVISPYDHVKIKKRAKKGRTFTKAERKAKRQGLYIMRGQWDKVELGVIQGYLTFIDDPKMKKNAWAVGGEAMLSVISKAEPRIPHPNSDDKDIGKGLMLRIRKSMKSMEFLQAVKANTNIASEIIDNIYERGNSAWLEGDKTASQEALARSRVVGFITGGKTRNTLDADLWRKHKGIKA